MNCFSVIGLMSGTSMDGIDCCQVYTNGKDLRRSDYCTMVPYKSSTERTLKKIMLNRDIMFNNPSIMHQIEKQVTLEHAEVVLNLIKRLHKKPDLIGFHGQTIYHNPKEKTSIQLGDGKLLAQLTKTRVIYNFRSSDIMNDGEGAPIAPIYHQSIMETLKLPKPCCFINIGGISNITIWNGRNLLGFDTGPGNCLLDQFMQKKFNKNFDFNGQLSLKGSPAKEIIKIILEDRFFYQPFPKSLDRLQFNYIFENLSFKKLNPEDALATLASITVESIIKGISLTDIDPSLIVLMGGGQNNLYIKGKLKEKYGNRILTSQELKIPGDFIEAELIAFLAARYENGFTSTNQYITGANSPTILGDAINPI